MWQGYKNIHLAYIYNPPVWLMWQGYKNIHQTYIYNPPYG